MSSLLSSDTKDCCEQHHKPPVLLRLPDIYIYFNCFTLKPPFLALGAGWGVTTQGASGQLC